MIYLIIHCNSFIVSPSKKKKKKIIVFPILNLHFAVGIVLFFLVEKVVRYVEDNSRKGTSHLSHGHHHHHHHHKHHNKVDDDDDNNDEFNSKHTDDKTRDIGDAQSQKGSVDEADEQVNDGNLTEHKALLRKVHPRFARETVLNYDIAFFYHLYDIQKTLS